MTLDPIFVYLIAIILGITVAHLTSLINTPIFPRILKFISISFFALYPVIIKQTAKLPMLEEHLNIVTFLLALWIFIFAELKEVSIFNADRTKLNLIQTATGETQEMVNSVKTTAGATQRAVNLIEDTVDETQDTVNSIENMAGATQRTVSSVQTTTGTTQETVNSVKTTADETQDTVNSIEDMANATQRTVNSVQTATGETQKMVNSVQTTADETQDTVSSVKTKVDDIGRQVSGLGEKIDNLPSTLTPESQDSSSQEADETQETVNLVETKVDNIGRQVSDLGEKIDNLPSTLTPESQENAVPSKFYVTMVLIACSVFISIVIGGSMFYTEQFFSSKTNSILQENSNKMADIIVSGLDTTITKIDSLQKNMQEQMQDQRQKEMKNLLDQIQKLSKKIDSQQSTPTPSYRDSSSTGSGDSP